MAFHGNPSKVIDHRDTKNPCEIPFGNDWKEEIDKTIMIGKVCVTDLIGYMFKEDSSKLGPADSFVYHNIGFDDPLVTHWIV